MNNYDEEDEEEKFFDSIDRIQSASGSETEDDNDLTSTSTVNTSLFPNYANPHFQMAISMYEVWIAEPGSIKERRMRLLQELGLSSDRGFSRLPSISRQSDRDSSEEEEGKGDGECSTSGRTIGASWDTELERSVSCDEFLRRPDPSLVSHVSGSRSDGALDLISASTSISDSSLCDGNQCNFSFSPLPPPVQSNGSSTRTHFVNNHSLLDSKISSSKHERNTLHSTATTNIVHSKPPVWKNPCPFSSKEQPPQSSSLIQGSGKSSSSSSTSSSSQGFDEIEKVKDEARHSFALDDSKSRSGDRVSNGELENGLHDPEVNGVKEEVVCTIKNLDNGKEFIVNEFREDGMWNKLREVETGRQLTMEEFEMSVGHSPIVQELMRRENVEELGNARRDGGNSNGNAGSKSKKKGGWFKSIKLVANTMTGHRDRRSSDEKDTSSEKGGRRSSSATDDSQDVLFHSPQRIKVRQYGKSCKELTALYMSQEIKAHKGSIWSIKFSLDGRYLASAGEDCAIHVWQVMELERKGDVLMEKPEDASIMHPYFFPCGSPEPALLLSNMDSHLENKKRGKISSSNRRSANLEHVFFPENMFLLSEKPVCSFQGHLADVFDLSWSKSQYLLSSSMDKTVRLWHMSSNSCLKMFSHSDYVTCIQFNPVDDRYFISGSLDSKVRIWSIPDRQVVDWSDLHEMVTAACYTPDGQGALVGSHKGSCRLYNTSGNKLNQEGQIDLQSKKKRSHVKKITGFQFAPGNSSEVLITSADSRIRVFYGVDLVHKFKGFRNTNSQITASLTANGKFVISASEDSHVYVWRYDSDSRMGRTKGVTITRSYEDFHCRDVSAAIPWPGFSNDKGGAVDGGGSTDNQQLNQTCWAKASTATASTPVEEANAHLGSAMAYGSAASPLHHSISSTNNFFLDRVSATWPEEKLLATINKRSPQSSDFFSNGMVQGRSAWGLVIVTAGLGGEIKVFQNFGLPVRI